MSYWRFRPPLIANSGELLEVVANRRGGSLMVKCCFAATL